MWNNTKEKNLKIFLSTQIICSLAFNFASTVISYKIFDLTGSPIKFALSFVLNNLPKLFTSVAGVLADRFDKKKLYLLIDIFGFIILISALGLGTSNDNLLQFYSLALGLLKSYSVPVTKSLVPFMAPKDGLLRTNAYEISNDKIARTLGPVIPLFLTPIFGFNTVLLITMSLYALSFLLKNSLQFDSTESINRVEQNFFSQFVDGFNNLFGNTGLLLLLINASITQFAFHPLISIVFPSIFKNIGYDSSSVMMRVFFSLASIMGKNSEKLWMNLTAVIGLGGALGTFISLWYLSIHKGIGERRGMTIGIVGQAIFGYLIYGVLTYQQMTGNLNLDILVLLLAIFNCGLYFSFNLFTIFFSVHYQKSIDRSTLGSFVGNMMLIFSLFYSIGALLYGYTLKLGAWIAPNILLVSIFAKLILYAIFISFSKNEEKVKIG